VQRSFFCLASVFIFFAAQIDWASAENCFNNPACIKRQRQQQFPQMPVMPPGQQQYPQQYPQQQYPQPYPQQQYSRQYPQQQYPQYPQQQYPQYPQQQYPQQLPQYPPGPPQDYQQSQPAAMPYPVCVTSAGTCDTSDGYGSNCVCSDGVNYYYGIAQ
jgi:hypothetical protein